MNAMEILRAQSCGQSRCQCHKSVRQGKGLTHCPAHDDERPSLSVSETTDGKTLVRCHAGCTQDAVLSELRSKGVGYAQRESTSRNRSNFRTPAEKSASEQVKYGSNQGSNQGSNTRSIRTGSDISLEGYAEQKGLPLEFLSSLGIREEIYNDERRLVIPYYDEDGNEVCRRYRKASGFGWRKGDKPIPYGLVRFVSEAPYSISAAVVEGESDAQTLWYHGFVALGIPGATTWQDEWACYLKDLERVYAVIEPDQGGERFRERLSSSLGEKLYLVSLDGAKDVSDYYLQDPDSFSQRFRAALDKAISVREIKEKEHSERVRSALDGSKDLREDPRLFDRIKEAIRQLGYVGYPRVPLLVYLSATSRHLDCPFHLCVVGPPAAGKTQAVKVGLSLIPEEDVYKVIASSPKALIHTDQDFKHRVIFMAEADSIPDDGPHASALRSLLTENRLGYEVTVKDPETGRFMTERISKPGPTVLITTSTKPFREQMRTRILELHLSDTPDQTREIMLSHAARATGEKTDLDLQPYHDLQRALAYSGIREVVIPYALELGETLPANDVRMRRCFEHLLSCIKTMAFLYQWQREVDDRGRIIATLDDYAMVKELLDPTFDAIVGDGISPAVRETVEAVGEGEEITQAELAKRLGLSKSTVSYRVNQALRGGWLQDLETHKGRPKRLARGEPLPEARTVLPDPEDLQAKFGPFEPDSNPYSNPQKGHKTPGQGQCEAAGFEGSNDFGGTLHTYTSEKTKASKVSSSAEDKEPEAPTPKGIPALGGWGVGDPKPCVEWGNLTPMRDPDGDPRHTRCAEEPDLGAPATGGRGGQQTGSVDVSDWDVGDPEPCEVCARPALLRNANGRPMHKDCARGIA